MAHVSGSGRKVEVITCALLERIGVPHGFTTRLGGVSAGAFSSLNFGNPGDLPADQRDPIENIRENQRLVLSAMTPECSRRELVEVWQVHGSAVHAVRAGHAAHIGPNDTKADAIVTDDPGRMLAVRVADCVPMLLSTHDGAAVAAIHAGWRGTVLGIVRIAVEELIRVHTRRRLAPQSRIEPRQLIAAIGPCIGAGGSNAFEVGPEVVEEFQSVYGNRPPPPPGVEEQSIVRASPNPGKSLISLQTALRVDLLSAGLAGENIEIIPRCTASEPELFFSHRRDRGLTGRMVGLIGPVGERRSGIA